MLFSIILILFGVGVLAAINRGLDILDRHWNPPPKQPQKVDPLPPEIEARVQNWAEPWAQEAARSSLREQYAMTGRWPGEDRE